MIYGFGVIENIVEVVQVGTKPHLAEARSAPVALVSNTLGCFLLSFFSVVLDGVELKGQITK
jgi:hypothetical protein